MNRELHESITRGYIADGVRGTIPLRTVYGSPSCAMRHAPCAIRHVQPAFSVCRVPCTALCSVLCALYSVLC